MTIAEQLGRFAARASYDELSDAARAQLKIRVLDSIACAIGALDGTPVGVIRAQIEDFGGRGPCSLIGSGHTAPDRAAFYNSALVRYLDFNDSYLTKRETCHPSDNLGAVLAVAEYADAPGRDFLAALALAYQVQCRLSDVAPVRDAGFDHVTQGAYAVAAGAARAMGLDAIRCAHAIAIAGSGFNALRVTRTGRLSQWKGLAYPNLAAAVTRTTFLARHGITGPLEVFEGEKGFMDAVAGYFQLDWDTENLERVTRTVVKKYNADIHSQSVLEAVLALRRREHFTTAEVARVEIDVFDVAHRLIGGGEEGDKTVVRTKEEADHSLPYLVAVALLDGDVMPAQYRPARIGSEDVQALLRQVVVRPDDALSRRFPTEMPCRVRVMLRDGRVLTAETVDYPGFLTRGRTWEAAREKLEQLAAPHTTSALRDHIAATVAGLDRVQVTELTALFGAVRLTPPATTAREALP
jgi:2-methylcitrate dehydratase